MCSAPRGAQAECYGGGELGAGKPAVMVRMEGEVGLKA